MSEQANCPIDPDVAAASVVGSLPSGRLAPPLVGADGSVRLDRRRIRMKTGPTTYQTRPVQ